MMWAYTLIVVVRARGAAADMRNAILGSSSACRRGEESTSFQGCWWDAGAAQEPAFVQCTTDCIMCRPRGCTRVQATPMLSGDSGGDSEQGRSASQVYADGTSVNAWKKTYLNICNNVTEILFIFYKTRGFTCTVELPLSSL